VHWNNIERIYEVIGDCTAVAAEELRYRFRATLDRAG
jgi:hypothetical protein